MMESVANAGATEPEEVAAAAEECETGVDEAEVQARLDAQYKEKKERLDKLEAETAELRILLAQKDHEIAELREELGLTTMAQIKRTVENSTVFQRTKELGDRVKSSETFQRTSSSLTAAGQATGAAMNTAATKTGEAFTKVGTSVSESQAWQDLSTRLKTASQSVKEKFTAQRTYSESSQNDEAEESHSYANTSS